MRVPGGWTVTLFDGRDFEGERLELTSDAPSLDRQINDRTSSVLITAPEPGGRLSPGEETVQATVHIVHSLT
ncbi:hypothetical protein ABZ865_39040 [Streptomyces sp. NPDC047085]|uniref:hypothetical protein n=1 Tax=Streptomyces sp. NPDC047085 TaxID=3155140 RepID=UPI0033D99E24